MFIFTKPQVTTTLTGSGGVSPVSEAGPSAPPLTCPPGGPGSPAGRA